MATNLTTRSSAKPARGSTCPGLFTWTWSRALWVCFLAYSHQMTQIQSYIVDIVTFWKSHLIRMLFIITEIIYIAIIVHDCSENNHKNCHESGERFGKLLLDAENQDNSFPGFFIAEGQQFDRFSSSYERIVSLPYKYHS